MPANQKVLIIGNTWVHAEVLHGHLPTRPEIFSLPQQYPVQQLDFMGDFHVVILNVDKTQEQNISEKLYTLRKSHPNVPVLLALPAQIPAIEVVSLGATDYIFSCFDRSMICEMVDRYLTSHTQQGWFWNQLLDRQRNLHFVSPALQMSAKLNPGEASADLYAHLTGSFRVTHKGVTVALPKGSRLRGLLAILLHAHPTGLTRRQLIRHFWPDIDSASANNNLSVNLHNLRKKLKEAFNETPVIFCEDDKYFINPDLLTDSDLAQADQCYDQGMAHRQRREDVEAEALFERALRVCNGDFLEDMQDESWTIYIREKWMERCIIMLEFLATRQQQQQNWAAAVQTLRAILLKDACIERLHRQIIMCFLHLDKPDEAVRQYQECVRVMSEKMRRKPDAATLQLVQAWL
jgi:DNA-binding SARP family transcriptional activator